MALLRLAGRQFAFDAGLLRSRTLPRWGMLAAVLLAGAGAFAATRGRWNPPAQAGRASAVAQGWARLPVALQPLASGNAGAGDHAYAIHPGAEALSASNPAQGLSESFSPSGPLVSDEGAHLGLELGAIGIGSSLSEVGPASPHARANRVSYQHPLVDEWYANGPLGLEQGFTVPRSPFPSARGALTLDLKVSGNVHPQLSRDGLSLILSRAGGPSLRYAGLFATDARGRPLDAWLSLQPGRILIHTQTAGARYPIHIDPFVNFAPLGAGGETAHGSFGGSAAISGDGNTAIVGGLNDSESKGAAWVYTRTGRSWAQQGTKLTGTGSAAGSTFGSSLALSEDGNTALVGGWGDSKDTGAAWVFTRSGGKWTQQGEKLTGAGESGEGLFGYHVALSADGNTALIGGPNDHKGTGAAWVFTRSGSSWTEQGKKLTGAGTVGEAFFGDDVALSGDGNTALIGGPLNNGQVGAAWVFTRSQEKWAQAGEKLTGAGETGEGGFGASVALSGDGSTALVGGGADNGSVGAVWVFTQSEGKWSQQGSKLTAASEIGNAAFGDSVSLSSDGDKALIGGYLDESAEGAAWAFARAEGQWSEVAKMTDEFETEEGQFGAAVALSGNGSLALISGGNGNFQEGEARTFFDLEPPTVTTEAPAEVTTSAAILKGTVNPHYEEVTECELEYGTTTGYGSSVPCSPAKPGGENGEPVPVSASIEGLTPNTTYHFRVTAAQFQGTSHSADRTFSTLQVIATGKSKAPAEPAEAVTGGLSVKATGGTGEVSIGRYGASIGGPALARAKGAYFQVFKHEESSFTKIEYKDCELGGAKTIWWDNAKAGWEPIREPTAVYSEAEKCVTVTATEATTPSVAQLSDPRHVGGPSAGEQFGKCVAFKHGLYSDGGCLTEDTKNGQPKGKFEFVTLPSRCYPLKHGRYADTACTGLDEKKGAPKGKYEAASYGATGAAGSAILGVQGSPSIECKAGTATSELLAPNLYEQTMTFSECLREGVKCSSPNAAAGTIVSEPLESYTYEEGSGAYASGLAGRQGAMMRFSCSSAGFVLSGLAAGSFKATFNTTITSTEAVFGEGVGFQELELEETKTATRHAATLTTKLVTKPNQPTEIRAKT